MGGRMLILPNDSLSSYLSQGNIEQFMDRIKEYEKAGIKIEILNFDEKEIKSSYNIKRIRPLPRPLLFFQIFFHLLKNLKNHDSIRVFEGGTFIKSALAVMAAKILGKKAIISIHGDYADLKGIRYKNQFLFPFFEIGREITKKADLIFVVSKYIGKKYPKGEYLPNYVNTDKFKPMDRKKKYEFIYVGSLLEVKGIPILIKAFKEIKRRIPKAKLLVIGDGPNKGILYDVDGVEYLGAIEHEKLPGYYNISKVFVTASLSESFCIPVVEAQACGLPAVAFDLPAIKENVILGKTGFLAERVGNASSLAKEAIEGLKRASSKNIKSLARKKALEYSKEKIIKKEIDKILKILKGSEKK